MGSLVTVPSPIHQKRRIDYLEFDSVASAIAETKLKLGMRVDVLGYSEEGDGGKASYIVVSAASGTVGQGYWDLDNGLQLEYVDDGGDLNALIFGVKCDLGTGNTDNATAIANVVAYSKTRSQSNGDKIVFPAQGPGYLSSAITVTAATHLKLTTCGSPFQLIATGTNQYLWTFVDCEDIEIEHCHFIGTSDTSTIYSGSNIKGGIKIDGGKNVNIHNNVFEKFVGQCIWVEDMTPATNIESVRIHHNTFRECPFDTSGTPTSDQCAVYLDTQAEYANVNENSFRDVPQAARFFNGANSNFKNNMVWACNASYAADRAAFYHEASDNTGKLHISGNHLNHNDSGLTIIYHKGDPLITINPVFIVDNDILSNGNVSNARQIHVQNSPNSVITGNNIRSNNNTVDELIFIEDSDNCVVRDNFLRRSVYAIVAHDCDINIGHNVYSDQGTGEFNGEGTGDFYYMENRSFTFHVTSAHAIESGDDSNITISGSTTGVYEFSHSIGNENYNVHCDACENASSVNFEIVKRNSVIDVYVTNNSNTLVDREFNMTVTFFSNSQYLLKNPRP